MTIVLHKWRGVCGHDVGVLEAVHLPFRALLYNQRLRPVQYQWAGSRFRNWRRHANNESQLRADRKDCNAWVAAYHAQADGPKLQLIQGGASEPPVSDAERDAVLQRVRERWAQPDGFARID